MEIIEVETRFRLNNLTYTGGIIRALESELDGGLEPSKVLHGADFYLDWERSKETGVWQRIRNHHVRQNGTLLPYQVSQTKTRIPSPPNPYGIECWRESHPTHADVPSKLERLRRDGYNPLVVQLGRRTYHTVFNGKRVEINIDYSLQPPGIFMEVGVDITNPGDIQQSTELVNGFIGQRLSRVLRSVKADAQVMPIYPIVLLNGK